MARPACSRVAAEVLEERTLLSADVVGRAANGAVYVGQSDGSSFHNDYAGMIDPAIDGDVFYGDFNGDGLTDMMVMYENGAGEDVIYRRLMQDNGNFARQKQRVISNGIIDGDIQYLGVGDVTGDMRDDFIFLEQDGAGPTFMQRVWYVEGHDQDLRSPTFLAQHTVVEWEFHGIADVDNDGVVEVIARSPLNGQWFQTDDNSWRSWGTWTPDHDYDNIVFGDFNNDGNEDIAGRIVGDGRWLVGLSNGTDRFVSQVFGRWTTNQTFSDVQVGDFDGDGDDDVFGRAANGSLVVGLSNGADRFISQSFGALSTTVGFGQILVSDFDEDGTDDIATVSASNAWVVGISDGTAFDLSVWARWSTGTTWDLIGSGDFHDLVM